MKKTICLLIAVLLLTAITACHKIQPADSSPANTVQPAATETQDAGTAPETEAEIERQDGEHFETVIMLEGMEETVRYEHIRNDSLGFEMDYDYESFVRYSDPVCDRFVSIYDDPEDPRNYLEIQCSAEDADTVASSVSESLSDDYEIIREEYTLDNAGTCIQIGASEVKGGGYTADQMQQVYIIPTDDGCRIATARYSAEGAEGFGRRFSYMVNTLKVIDRTADFADSTDFDDPTAEYFGGWTGADFGELPPEDFGELPAESGITEEMAYEGVYNYCRSAYDWSIAEDDPSMMYVEMGDESETEYQVIFHSYTGAIVYFYVDKSDGTARMTEYVPALDTENEAGSTRIFDYL